MVRTTGWKTCIKFASKMLLQSTPSGVGLCNDEELVKGSLVSRLSYLRQRPHVREDSRTKKKIDTHTHRDDCPHLHLAFKVKATQLLPFQEKAWEIEQMENVRNPTQNEEQSRPG